MLPASEVYRQVSDGLSVPMNTIYGNLKWLVGKGLVEVVRYGGERYYRLSRLGERVAQALHYVVEACGGRASKKDLLNMGYWESEIRLMERLGLLDDIRGYLHFYTPGCDEEAVPIPPMVYCKKCRRFSYLQEWPPPLCWRCPHCGCEYVWHGETSQYVVRGLEKQSSPWWVPLLSLITVVGVTLLPLAMALLSSSNGQDDS